MILPSRHAPAISPTTSMFNSSPAFLRTSPSTVFHWRPRTPFKTRSFMEVVSSWSMPPASTCSQNSRSGSPSSVFTVKGMSDIGRFLVLLCEWTWGSKYDLRYRWSVHTADVERYAWFNDLRRDFVGTGVCVDRHCSLDHFSYLACSTSCQ